jgi:hypothetical protein
MAAGRFRKASLSFAAVHVARSRRRQCKISPYSSKMMAMPE